MTHLRTLSASALCAILGATAFSTMGCVASEADSSAAIEGDEEELRENQCLFGSSVSALDRSSWVQKGSWVTLTKSSVTTGLTAAHLRTLFPSTPETKDIFALVDGSAIKVRSLVEVTAGRRFVEYRYAVNKVAEGAVFGALRSDNPSMTEHNGNISLCAVKFSKPRVEPIDCVFGVDTNELFSSDAIKIDHVKDLTPSSKLTALEQKQILKGTKASSLDAAFKQFDEETISIWHVVEKSTGRSFWDYGGSWRGMPGGFAFADGGTEVLVLVKDDATKTCYVSKPL